MSIEIQIATTEAEREAIYRFRYDIYVEEMGRYQATADHDRRRLVEPEDATGTHVFAVDDTGDVVGVARGSWGGAGPFSKRQVRQYGLEPFMAEIPADRMTVGERAMIRPDHRGTDLWLRFMQHSLGFANEKRIVASFGACEPHLLSLYLGLGARTFADQNINSAEAGYLIPILWLPGDARYLQELGSPLAAFAEDRGLQDVPPVIHEVIATGGAVRSHRLSADDTFGHEVHNALDELGDGSLSAVAGLTDDEVALLLDHSNIIDCCAGDLVLKKGGVARNLFVVLDGFLEVRNEDRVLSVLGPGQVFGEMAFLLEQPRTRDVYAATDGTRVLSLSEGHLRRLIDREPRAAALLLMNLSRMLCFRLITQV